MELFNLCLILLNRNGKKDEKKIKEIRENARILLIDNDYIIDYSVFNEIAIIQKRNIIENENGKKKAMEHNRNAMSG